MLSKNVKLTINDYTAKLSSPLKFFKNDSLYIMFEIYEFGIAYTNGRSKFRETPIDQAISAVLLIETPFGVDSIEAMSIEENQILFHLDENYTKYVGTSKMQIVLLDENKYKITLPHFEFEIKKSINEKWDGEEVTYPNIILTDDGSVILADDETTLIR